MADDARRIAVVPAYNEEATVAAVLGRLYPLVDELVVVDDGSTDRTRAEIRALAAGRRPRPHAVVRHATVACRRRTTSRSPTCAGACRTASSTRTTWSSPWTPTASTSWPCSTSWSAITQEERLDALLVRRDLTTYPRYKQLGNRLMSRWATLWAAACSCSTWSPATGCSGWAALADALEYYRGYRYSETVEVAIVMSRLGYAVRNDVLVTVPVFRSRTRMKDVVIDLVADPARPRCGSPAAGRRDSDVERSAVVEVAGSAEQVVEAHRRRARVPSAPRGCGAAPRPPPSGRR